MHTLDRRGVHIEQCQGCKGIFLDRGELEQLANAEQTFYAAAPPPYRDSPPPYGGGHDPRYRGQTAHYEHRDSPPPYGHKRRRRGFMEELFD